MNEDLAIPATHEPIHSRTMAAFGNHHLWFSERAMNGYEPLILNATAKLLANPDEDNIYYRAMKMERNPSAASVLKRPFWLVPAYVKGGPPGKTRLFPPTQAVFLREPPKENLPQVALEDLPETMIANPREEIVLRAEGSTKHLIYLGVQLPKQNSALFIHYQSVGTAKFSVTLTGVGYHQGFRFKNVPVAATGAETAIAEFPLPDFAKVDIWINIVGEEGVAKPTVGRIAIVSDRNDESERIEFVRDTPDRVALEVRDLPGPRALVFTDAAYPGWQAFVDDVRVPLYLANDAFKAVIIAQGTHTVRFEFRPWRVSVGVTISLMTATLALLSMLWCFRREDNSVAP